MAAPEKIYLWESELCGRDYDDEWYNRPLNEDSVEYVRADAFIEKAAIWIEEHTSLSEKLVIEDFKNYMKG